MFEPKDVLAVHYMIAQSPKRLTGIKVFFRDGTSKVFLRAELAAALAIVKIAFRVSRPGLLVAAGEQEVVRQTLRLTAPPVRLLFSVPKLHFLERFKNRVRWANFLLLACCCYQVPPTIKCSRFVMQGQFTRRLEITYKKMTGTTL